MSNTKFIKIGCPRCNHCQIIFGRSSTRIKCLKCNRLLIKTTGGKAIIKARVIKIWN